MRSVTAKDVLYALERTGAELVRWPGGTWTLEPDGQKIAPRVAETVRSHGSVVSVHEQPAGKVHYRWRTAA